MKIIAKTRTGYILDATEREVNNLMSNYYPHQKINIGDEIDINKLVNKVNSFQSFLNKHKEIQNMKDDFERLLYDFTLIIPADQEK